MYLWTTNKRKALLPSFPNAHHSLSHTDQHSCYIIACVTIKRLSSCCFNETGRTTANFSITSVAGITGDRSLLRWKLFPQCAYLYLHWQSVLERLMHWPFSTSGRTDPQRWFVELLAFKCILVSFIISYTCTYLLVISLPNNHELTKCKYNMHVQTSECKASVYHWHKIILKGIDVYSVTYGPQTYINTKSNNSVFSCSIIINSLLQTCQHFYQQKQSGLMGETVTLTEWLVSHFNVASLASKLLVHTVTVPRWWSLEDL